MNFLAHAVLAGNRADVIAGSAAGDFVKGVLYDNQYPKDFLFGIRLHRRIDAFSNQEPNLRISANRLPASLRRIGPPCIDMLADHFLARAALRQPADYLPVIEDALTNTANPPQPTPPTHTLQTYEDRLHTLLLAHRGRLSPAARRFFSHAKTTRLFSSYADFGRVSRGIGYVCERLGRADDGSAVVRAIEAEWDALEADFLAYWPALLGEARRFCTEGGYLDEAGGRLKT